MKGLRRLAGAWAATLALVLSGCALVPPEPIVTGPLTAPPPPQVPPMAEANGSIYQPTAYGNYPLFEDRRPRNVGDIVTIVIQEKTNAAKNVNTNTNRSGSASMGIGLSPDFLPDDLGPKQNFDATGSIGPWLVPYVDESQLADIKLETRVNGEVRQQDRTSRMIFSFRKIINYISTFTTLVPGDVIVCGTPTGAGARFDPPIWLKPGDVVEVEAEGIGMLRNTIADEKV